MINDCDACFDDILDKMNELQGPSEDLDPQIPYGESLLYNQPLQEKCPFQRLEIYKHAWLRSTMTQESFSNLTVLNSHKATVVLKSFSASVDIP